MPGPARSLDRFFLVFPEDFRMKRALSLTVVTIALILAMGLLAWAVDGDDIPLPSGTELVVKLTNTLSSKGSEEGDPWAGKVE